MSYTQDTHLLPLPERGSAGFSGLLVGSACLHVPGVRQVVGSSQLDPADSD